MKWLGWLLPPEPGPWLDLDRLTVGPNGELRPRDPPRRTLRRAGPEDVARAALRYGQRFTGDLSRLFVDQDGRLVEVDFAEGAEVLPALPGGDGREVVSDG